MYWTGGNGFDARGVCNAADVSGTVLAATPIAVEMIKTTESTMAAERRKKLIAGMWLLQIRSEICDLRSEICMLTLLHGQSTSQKEGRYDP
jgi:hypothetical protein